MILDRWRPRQGSGRFFLLPWMPGGERQGQVQRRRLRRGRRGAAVRSWLRRGRRERRWCRADRVVAVGAHPHGRPDAAERPHHSFRRRSAAGRAPLYESNAPRALIVLLWEPILLGDPAVSSATRHLIPATERSGASPALRERARQRRFEDRSRAPFHAWERHRRRCTDRLTRPAWPPRWPLRKRRAGPGSLRGARCRRWRRGSPPRRPGSSGRAIRRTAASRTGPRSAAA